MNIKINGPYYEKSEVCEPILHSLPDWFGIEEAVTSYVREINELPTLIASSEGQVLAFLSVKQHNPYAAEIFVMGVRPEMHRHGIGRSLIFASEAWLRKQGVEYLQVKTLGPSRRDENYARTRAFYQAMGFRPLEEFTQIWNEQNPCLLMIKKL